jgi:hypothetical protein
MHVIPTMIPRLAQPHATTVIVKIKGKPHTLFYNIRTSYWRIDARLFVFKPHEQFFSYQATVTIAGGRAANLDLCLAFMAFSSEGFFYVPHLLRHGTSVFKVISERPMILTSECRALVKGAIATYFKRLRFDAPGTSGAQTPPKC